MEKLGSHWTDFHEIFYLSMFRKSVEKIQESLKSDKKRLLWSRGSVMPLSTQVRGLKPGQSRQDFSGRKNPQHAFLRRGSKVVGPMS
jgi:hypothetical protein